MFRASRNGRWFRVFPLILWLFSSLFVGPTYCHAEGASWVYAVQISAVVATNPARITLNWQPDDYGANSWTIYRKAKEATSWGAALTNMPGSALSFTDSNVVAGVGYEYQIIKTATLGYYGYGYIYAAINLPLIENRGKIVLVVATNATASLSNELARLETDLIGDGWQVLRRNVSSNDTPLSVRTLITNAYYAEPTNVNAVFFFGHVPILQSGNLNYDGHLDRAMPADSYYADVNDDWPTNSATSPGFLPSDVKLMVGRVDLFNMPGVGAPAPWPNETELLRNYLNKDHKWRTGLLPVRRAALMGNPRGDENGEATATSGYRNFEPMVGPGNTLRANIEPTAPTQERWFLRLLQTNYLWAYGNGGGQPTAVSGLGTNDGSFYDVRSTDIVAGDPKAIFVMLFGSWFGNWDYSDDLMRSVLAAPTMGLTCCMAGRPHWFLHHMAMGDPIGYSTRLSMNNSTLYQNQSNGMVRAVYVNLMGDPTLRLEPVSPPGPVTLTPNVNGVLLSWTPSTNVVAGYHVYRAAATNLPFVRITPSLLTGTTFTDQTVTASINTYMVRAVALQTNPSGSYYNPSQGSFATIANFVPGIRVSGRRVTNGMMLTWNSVAGAPYHVEAKPSLPSTLWSSLFSTNASGAVTSWTDTNALTLPQRFYRVVSP